MEIDASGMSLAEIFGRPKAFKKPKSVDQKFDVWLASLEVYGCAYKDYDDLRACRRHSLKQIASFVSGL
jgi:hypothetical protein